MNTLVRTELPRQIADNITSTFEINGAIALTAENAKHVFTDLISQPEGPIQQLLEGQRALMQATSSDNSNNSTATTTTTENGTDHSSYHPHYNLFTAGREAKSFTRPHKILNDQATRLMPCGYSGFVAILHSV